MSTVVEKLAASHLIAPIPSTSHGGDVRMPSTTPSIPPRSGARRYDAEVVPATLKRKPSGRRLDRFIDPQGHMQGSPNSAAQQKSYHASTRPKLSVREQSRGRQNSLRRVKNSKEVMRQRSSNRNNQELTPDGNSGSREGRQFTVANVGNNGRIYLRYV